MDRIKRIWYLSHMRAAKVLASLRIRAVSPEPSLLAHTSSESRGTFRQKARSLAPLNGCTCAVEICHDGMLEDTNSLDGAHMACRQARASITLKFQVYGMSARNFVASVSFTNNIMQNQAIQSHMCINLNTKTGPAGSYKTVSNWLVSQSTKELDFPPSDAWLQLLWPGCG